ncbi:MAG: hypothetical protein JW854_04660 [Actinobacteria bacterium]|nr:hypothetical protein [Actinomycetota bacterium]
MPEINTCPECGVPLYISSIHEWSNNGVILSRRESSQRLVLYECGNLDPLFDGIAEMLEAPIERIIIDASRRSTRSYMDHVVPGDVKALIRSREIDLDIVFDSTFLIWRAMGYGNLSLHEVRYDGDRGDYISVLAERPYSIPLAVGNFAGSIEALVGREPGVEYEEISPGLYMITIFEAENPSHLKERLRWKGYDQEYKEGDIELERCSSCGVPAGLKDFSWDQVNGSIRSAETGRRMVLTGPSIIEPIFDDLEEELGDTIPRIVVEAQKRFIRSGFFSVDEVISEENMRTSMALRGLGNLRELKMGRRGVRSHIENAALPLLAVGLTQGLYEKAFDIYSKVEWELSEDGDLTIEVAPSF